MSDPTYNPDSTAARVLAYIVHSPLRDLLKEPVPMTATQAAEEIREYLLAPATPTPTVEITLAADVGNARTAIMVQAAGQDRPTLIQMPTVRSLDVVFARDVFDRRGLASDAWRQLGAHDHIITADGMDRFLGDLAVDFARSQSSGRGSDNRYSDGTTAEFMLAGMSAAAKGQAKFAVRCATLLPIKLWPSQAAKVEQHLRQTWGYSYNGKPIEAKFESVKAFREGEAAFYALPKKPQGRAIVVDGGGRTVNVALFGDGVYRDGDTIDNMGVEAALDNLDRALEIDRLPRLTMGQRIELQAALKDGHPYSLSHRQTSHRIDGKARKIFDATARTLVQELARLFQMEAAEGGAFVGGAAFPTFFGDIIHDAYKVIELVDNPETKNVEGAFVQIAGQPAKKAKRK